MQAEEEEKLLRSVAIQNAKSILLARQRAEEELVRAKDALERKTEELAGSLSMMRATLESTTDGILVTDADGIVTGFNKRYVQMWGIPRTIMEAAKHYLLVEANSRKFADPNAFKAKVQAIYANAYPETFDLLNLADGRTFERFTRIQLVEGQVVGRVWSFRDITERRRAEDALRDETRILELLNATGTSAIPPLAFSTNAPSASSSALPRKRPSRSTTRASTKLRRRPPKSGSSFSKANAPRATRPSA